MNALLIVAGLFVLYELMTRGNIFPPSGAGQATGVPVPFIQGGQPVSAPGYQYVAPSGAGVGPSQGTMMIGSSVAMGSSLISTGAIGSAIGLAGTTLGAVIPVVGAAFAAIFSALMAASAKRAAEARSENSAVAKEIPQWDNAIDQIVLSYNGGSITADEAVRLLACPQTRQQGLSQYPNGAVWLSYWNVVAPQIQPGRNACQSGQAPHQPPLTHCGGSYGAACCVGYDNLDNGQYYVAKAIVQAEQQAGVPVTSTQIPTVYASKYGGIDRPGYSVTVMKPASMTFAL